MEAYSEPGEAIATTHRVDSFPLQEASPPQQSLDQLEDEDEDEDPVLWGQEPEERVLPPLSIANDFLLGSMLPGRWTLLKCGCIAFIPMRIGLTKEVRATSSTAIEARTESGVRATPEEAIEDPAKPEVCAKPSTPTEESQQEGLEVWPSNREVLHSPSGLTFISTALSPCCDCLMGIELDPFELLYPLHQINPNSDDSSQTMKLDDVMALVVRHTMSCPLFTKCPRHY